MLRSILSNPSLCPYSNSLATRLVMGVVFLVLARFSRSIHSHVKHSCRQKLIVKEHGCRRQIRYMSDFPKAPGCLCCCRMLSRDLNSDFTPVSSNTSRTAVSPTWKRGTNRDFVPRDAVKGFQWKSGRLKAKLSSNCFLDVVRCTLYLICLWDTDGLLGGYACVTTSS